MPNYTSNYNLTKPLPTDLYDIEVQNGNMDKIDEALSDVYSTANKPSAADVTAGTFPATGMKMPAGTDYTTARIRNAVFTASDPGAGTSSSHVNGTLVFVYE